MKCRVDVHACSSGEPGSRLHTVTAFVMPQNLGNRELQFWALGRSGFLGRTDAGDQGGNKGYCVSLKLEAEKAKLPGFSNSKMYPDFQKAGFDVRR